MLEVWLAFMAGLAGSGHCLGMCGGIVTALALAHPERTPLQRLLHSLLYHSGRICTYAILGLVAGAAAQTALLSLLKPYLLWGFVLANLAVILTGLGTALNLRLLNLSSLDGSGWRGGGGWLRRAGQLGSCRATLAAGLVLGLIPCGMVYGVLVTAATSGSWSRGGLIMLSFGLGTLPSLVVCGQLASSNRFGPTFSRVVGIAVMALGSVTLWKTIYRLGIFHH